MTAFVLQLVSLSFSLFFFFLVFAVCKLGVDKLFQTEDVLALVAYGPLHIFNSVSVPEQPNG